MRAASAAAAAAAAAASAAEVAAWALASSMSLNTTLFFSSSSVCGLCDRWRFDGDSATSENQHLNRRLRQRALKEALACVCSHVSSTSGTNTRGSRRHYENCKRRSPAGWPSLRPGWKTSSAVLWWTTRPPSPCGPESSCSAVVALLMLLLLSSRSSSPSWQAAACTHQQNGMSCRGRTGRKHDVLRQSDATAQPLTESIWSTASLRGGSEVLSTA